MSAKKSRKRSFKSRKKFLFFFIIVILVSWCGIRSRNDTFYKKITNKDKLSIGAKFKKNKKTGILRNRQEDKQISSRKDRKIVRKSAI